MSSSAIKEQKKHLFDYWDEIPVTKVLSPDEFEVIRSKDGKTNLRTSIISIMAQGIKDTYPGEGDTKRKRHALCAKEIKKELEKDLDEEITLSNVYFHLQKLEESGLVEIIGSLPSGRRFTAYYGRVSRAFMLDTDVTFPVIKHFDTKNHADTIDNLFELIRRKNPDMTDEEIQNLRNKVVSINQHRIEHDKKYSEAYEKWMEKHLPVLKDLDANLIDIYYVFLDLMNFQDEIIEVFNTFQNLLGISEFAPDISDVTD